MKGVKMISPCCNKMKLMASLRKCVDCIKPKRTRIKLKYTPVKPKNSKAKENSDYYRAMWERHSIKQCEECGIYLQNYSASFISHIIPKGANTFLRSEPENHNLLCLTCHNQWEFGDRKTMKIFPKNLETIERLTRKYYELGNRG